MADRLANECVWIRSLLLLTQSVPRVSKLTTGGGVTGVTGGGVGGGGGAPVARTTRLRLELIATRWVCAFIIMVCVGSVFEDEGSEST